MNLVLWKAKSGISTATDWDKAAAYFFGSGGASDSEHTVYNRAQKRCKNYGTCLSTGEAKVNALIAQALNSKSDKSASYDNIVKQFKLSCSKAQSGFKNLTVRNSTFSAIIERFTHNTYIMVITSDHEIEPAATIMNVDCARVHFQKIAETTTGQHL